MVESWFYYRDLGWRSSAAGWPRGRLLGDTREIRDSDVVGNIVRNFARQPVKESALALLERAETVRNGTVRHLQQGKQGLEQREADGKDRSTLAATFARRRDDREIGQAAERIARRMREQRALMRRLRDLGARIHDAVRAAVRRAREREAEARTAAAPRKRGVRR